MLDENEVKRIVQMTVRELKRQDLLQAAEISAYKEISDRLKDYFAPFSSDDKELTEAIDELNDDKYKHILWMFYRDGYTVEEIAEKLNVDARTVSRNKKRICLELYTKLMF